MSKHHRFIATISKEFTFDAAHHLPTVPPDHKCHRMHGHTYRVELVIRDEVHENGFVGGLDYADLAALWSIHCHEILDHRVLNEIPGLAVPSTENLGAWIIYRLHQSIPGLVSARVHESSTTWCEVTKLELVAAGLISTVNTKRVRIPHKEA